MQTDRLGGDDVLERTTLNSGEYLRIDRLGVLLLADDETGTRAAQALVRRLVTKSAMGQGFGCTPPATSPAMCAMSTKR